MSIEDDHYWEEIEKRQLTFWTIEKIVKKEVNDYLKKQLDKAKSQVEGWIIIEEAKDKLRKFCYESF